MLLLSIKIIIFLENVLLNNTISVDTKRQFLLQYFQDGFLRTSRKFDLYVLYIKNFYPIINEDGDTINNINRRQYRVRF